MVVSNQSGIGRGYVSLQKVKEINAHMLKLLKKKRASIDAVYFCPHKPGEGCECRKPKLGLVKKARVRFRIDLKRSYTIGDHANDFILAKNMGGKGIFVLTGHGRKELKSLNSRDEKPYKITKNVLSAAKLILKETR